MMPIQTPSGVTISERINKIRLRAHLERVCGISVDNREAFLEVCQRYEQGECIDLTNLDDPRNSERDTAERDTFTDWDKWDKCGIGQRR